MKPSFSRRASLVVFAAVVAATSSRTARAQGGPPPTEATPPPGSPTGAAATPPADPATSPKETSPVVAPAIAPAPVVAPLVAPAGAAPSVQVVPGEPPAQKWYDAIKFEAFVDAYASMNFNSPKPVSSQNPGRPFDVYNGFAVHWAGVNASYAPDPVGGTIGLRFGPGALLYNAGVDNTSGLQFVKQAFVSWKPVTGAPIQIDFGKFDSWIGSEVADSQYNMTYTRSTLFMTQPYFHTGLRVDFALSDQFDLKLFAVNGVNNSIDNNTMKTFGASAGITPSKQLAFYANYIGGPEQPTFAPVTGMPGTVALVPGVDSRFRHLVDVVADLRFDKARILVNGNYGTEKLPGAAPTDPETNVSWYGANLTVGYAVTSQFAVAVRGAYLEDPDGYITPAWGTVAGYKASVVDGTLTLALTPTPNLVIKLEPRIDAVSSDAPDWEGGFPRAPSETPAVAKTMFTTTLGVVATTN